MYNVVIVSAIQQTEAVLLFDSIHKDNFIELCFGGFLCYTKIPQIHFPGLVLFPVWHSLPGCFLSFLFPLKG